MSLSCLDGKGKIFFKPRCPIWKGYVNKLPTHLALSPVPGTCQLCIEGDQKVGIKGGRTNYEIDVVCPLFFQVIEREVGEGPWAITFAIPQPMGCNQNDIYVIFRKGVMGLGQRDATDLKGVPK